MYVSCSTLVSLRVYIDMLVKHGAWFWRLLRVCHFLFLPNFWIGDVFANVGENDFLKYYLIENILKLGVRKKPKNWLNWENQKKITEKTEP